MSGLCLPKFASAGEGGAGGAVIELFGAGSDASKQFKLTYTHLWGIGY
ncbi:MAG: hypothetical protein NT092_07610 [Bacteroidia bacterium]|nr:hypothetical protein [Bacteroidia bacterium]